nr:MAG TPA: hypothetical protein [Caudoviricetes sp.]
MLHKSIRWLNEINSQIKIVCIRLCGTSKVFRL